MPEGVDLRFVPGEGLRNPHLLIAANRFVGYPSTFYDERVAEDSLWSVCPLESRLPCDYSGLPRLYEIAGMPDDGALKRVLFERPELILLMLGMPGAPFGSIAMLRQFFELPNAENLLYEFCSHRCSCNAWQWLGSLKGEKAVFEFGLYEMKDLKPEDAECMSLEGIGKLLERLGQQGRQRKIELLASCDSREPKHAEMIKYQ